MFQFFGGRRQAKPAEDNQSQILRDSEPTSSRSTAELLETSPILMDNESTSYSKTMMLQMRQMLQGDGETHKVKMRPVAELPDIFQTPDWKQRNPVKALTDSKIAANDEMFLSDVRSILGKLAVGSFGTLCENLLACGVDTPERLSMLTTELFDIATKQQPLLPMCADLCEILAKDARISSLLDPVQDSFPQLLLRQCQNFITNLLLPRSDEESQDKMQLEEESLHRKQRALGHMKLIGHLLVKHMVTSKMFVEWAGELLAKRNTCPEALESLAAFLMVAGPEFDNPAWEHYARFQELIAAIRKVAKSKSTPSRARFILKDVLDARDAGWLNNKESRLQNTQQQADNLDVSLFDMVAFRRILASVLADLVTSQDVAAAVHRIRLQQVPVACQVQQTADMLTRIFEEKRGPHRRRAIAFAVGLVASEQGAFDRKMFLDGLGAFFCDVYEELCHEVPRLTSMISTELVPVLLGVYTKAEVSDVMPCGLYCPSLRT